MRINNSSERSTSNVSRFNNSPPHTFTPHAEAYRFVPKPGEKTDVPSRIEKANADHARFIQDLDAQVVVRTAGRVMVEAQRVIDSEQAAEIYYG